MFDFAADSDSTDDTSVSPTGLAMPEVEVLMYALPHHQERIRPSPGSTNAVQNIGCQAIIHGIACPVRCLLLLLSLSCPAVSPSTICSHCYLTVKHCKEF
jgi:hypothetical protein